MSIHVRTDRLNLRQVNKVMPDGTTVVVDLVYNEHGEELAVQGTLVETLDGRKGVCVCRVEWENAS